MFLYCKIDVLTVGVNILYLAPEMEISARPQLKKKKKTLVRFTYAVSVRPGLHPLGGATRLTC